MNRFIVETDNATNAKHFLRLMKELKYVKSIVPEKEQRYLEQPETSSKKYNWLNPTRPATDEEFEQMIAECEAEYEAGLFIPIEEAKEKTLKEIREWGKQNSK